MRIAVIVLVSVLLFASGARAQGSICAEGGGALGAGPGKEWSAPVFAWMIEKGKRGTVVVLGAPQETAAPAGPGPITVPAGDDAPRGNDPLVQGFLEAGAARVVDLRPTHADAEQQATADAVSKASVVFIRGGSQTEYVKLWKGTRLEAAIRAVFDSGGVVGGTSAGCAVLGEVIYDAMDGSCAAIDALTDARTKKISFTTDFLQLTRGVLFDTHFTERARLGRLAVMLAQCERDMARDVLGIGIDARTALCIGPDGIGEVFGQGAATALALTKESRIVIDAGKPPVVTHLSQTQMVAGQKYDLRNRKLLTLPPVVGSRVSLNVQERDLAASVTGRIFTPVTVKGETLVDCENGQWRVSDLDDREALWNGRLQINTGEARLKGVIVQTRTLDSEEFLENRLGGPLWGVAMRPGTLAVWLTRGSWVGVRKGVLAVLSDSDADTLDASAIFLESAGIGNIGFSLAKSGTNALGPRQAAAFEGAVLHVLAPGWSYDAHQRTVLGPLVAPPAATPGTSGGK